MCASLRFAVCVVYFRTHAAQGVCSLSHQFKKHCVDHFHRRKCDLRIAWLVSTSFQAVPYQGFVVLCLIVRLRALSQPKDNTPSRIYAWVSTIVHINHHIHANSWKPYKRLEAGARYRVVVLRSCVWLFFQQSPCRRLIPLQCIQVDHPSSMTAFHFPGECYNHV